METIKYVKAPIDLIKNSAESQPIKTSYLRIVKVDDT